MCTLQSASLTDRWHYLHLSTIQNHRNCYISIYRDQISSNKQAMNFEKFETKVEYVVFQKKTT